MTDTDTIAADLEAQVGAYAERIFQTGLATLEAITISLGRELGLYQHLTEAGGLTPAELARRAGIDERAGEDAHDGGNEIDERSHRGQALRAQEALLAGGRQGIATLVRFGAGVGHVDEAC